MPTGNARIYGGSAAGYQEYPFQVLITGVRTSPDLYIKVCGGTILSARYVLTAASCFFNE